MSDTFMISKKACADGDTDTGANLTDYVGYVVKLEGLDCCSLVVENGAATFADRPIGIIKQAADATFGYVTIVTHGPVHCIVGAETDPGVDDVLGMPNASGLVIPLAVPADAPEAAGVWSVGYYISERGTQAVAANDQIKIFVQPNRHGNRYAAQ